MMLWLRRGLLCVMVVFMSGCVTGNRKDQAEPAQVVSRSGKEESVVLEDPAVYQYLFQKVEKALFVRKGLEGGGRR